MSGYEEGALLMLETTNMSTVGRDSTAKLKTLRLSRKIGIWRLLMLVGLALWRRRRMNTTVNGNIRSLTVASCGLIDTCNGVDDYCGYVDDSWQ